jgi:hypothetical protein
MWRSSNIFENDYDKSKPHSVQNILSARLLSENAKIRIYKTKILPVVLYGYETWSLII